MYLLDTDACIRLLNDSSSRPAQRLRQYHASDIALCSIVKAELTYGAYRSRRVAENLRLLDQFFDPFISLPFDDHCVEAYGRIHSDLERVGTPIGPNDLMIAATAVANDLTLITANTREFGRVIGLTLENWESGE